MNEFYEYSKKTQNFIVISLALFFIAEHGYKLIKAKIWRNHFNSIEHIITDHPDYICALVENK